MLYNVYLLGNIMLRIKWLKVRDHSLLTVPKKFQNFWSTQVQFLTVKQYSRYWALVTERCLPFVNVIYEWPLRGWLAHPLFYRKGGEHDVVTRESSEEPLNLQWLLITIITQVLRGKILRSVLMLVRCSLAWSSLLILICGHQQISKPQVTKIAVRKRYIKCEWVSEWATS